MQEILQNKWIVSLLFAILIGVFFYSQYLSKNNWEKVSESPECVIGIVYQTNLKNILIHYRANNKIYNGVGNAKTSKTMSYTDINVGDSILVIYNSQNPDDYIIDFDNRYGLCN